MGSRRRSIMSLSLSPDIAEEYKNIARSEGKTVSGLFRDMFNFYKQEKLIKEFYGLQEYGAEKVKRLNITEEEIERLIFEGR
ncbi:MAG: CopG family transcriptional regulator [Deltaproteobacteria bacterium]|nr:CopG family transcriptional regulator [Deltaproteobacteria bacterium]